MDNKTRFLISVILLFCSLQFACNLSTHLLPPSNTPMVDTLQATINSTEIIQPTATATPLPTATPVPALRIKSGEQALRNGDWDTAQDEYINAYTSSGDPEVRSAAILGKARTQLSRGQSEAAIDSLENLILDYSETSDLASAYFNLGQAYYEAGRYIEASDAYLNYLALNPGLIDAYVLNLRGDALQSGGSFAEAANDYRAALQSPSFLNRTELQIKIARTHAMAGDYSTAIALYDEIYNQSNSEYIKAQMDYLKGRAYTALGQMDDAYATYLDAVNNYPASYDTYQALILLIEAGVTVNELNRGIVDYYAGQYGVALAAFDRYLQTSTTDIATARYYNGLTHRSLGNYEEAINEWEKIIKNFTEHHYWDEAWEQKAYTQWAFLEDYDSAIKTLLDFTSQVPDHPRAAEFIFDAALVSDIAGQLDQAAKSWERVAREYPGYEKATRALFLSGIAHYRLGAFEQAFSTFRSVLANATTLEESASSFFWQAKSQQALGDVDAARIAMEQAMNADPTGYYSERAKDILRESDPFTPPEVYDLAMDLEAERQQAEIWMKSTFALAPETDLSSTSAIAQDARFQRGTELWHLGLYEESRLEFEDLRLSMQSDAVGSFQLANHLVELGMYRGAILSSRQVLNLAGMDDASSLTAPVYFNHIRFGPFYADLILQAAQQYEFHPLFLMSVVRQESAYEGFVRSSAGARGLMQIMTPTAEEIVEKLGWPENYQAEDLYRPIVNITLGTSYLAEWRDRLGSDLYAALAAYNAGPGNASEWQKLANGDVDLFLEVVRYEETRNYIRGVYEIFNIYRRLYDRTP